MRCSKSGFTLVEAMVAVALLGLIATVVGTGMRLAVDLSTRGNSQSESFRTDRLQRNVLRSQLKGALPFLYWIRQNGDRLQRFGFEGDPSRVRFVSRYGLSDGPDSFPRWVTISSEQAVKGQSIRLEERRILPPDNQPDSTPTLQASLLNCTELRFAYLDTTDKVPTWVAKWDHSDQKPPLPSGIRMDCQTSAELIRLTIPLDYGDSAKQGLLFQ